MPEFFQTMMGRKFYEKDVVDVVEHLKKIANEMERSNELKEQELRIKREKNKNCMILSTLSKLNEDVSIKGSADCNVNLASTFYLKEDLKGWFINDKQQLF